MPYLMTHEQRERAKVAAGAAAGQIDNGPTAGDLNLASRGMNEDLLYAVHLIQQAEAYAARAELIPIDMNPPRLALDTFRGRFKGDE